MTVEATGIHRAFGGVLALRDASFTARPGEIHALAGENGAGKSTLIKVLCGVLRADAGTVTVSGRVATAFQELSLLPDLTVAENLLLTAPPRGRLGLVRRSHLAAEASRLLSLYGVSEIDPRSPARDLAVSQKQVVELVRVLALEPDVVFLDEPTAALAQREVDWLAGHMRRLRDGGACVVFTSHRWREIERLADRVTVFRNGTHVATRERLTEDEAITLMTGRTLDATYPDVSAIEVGENALTVTGLTSGRLRDVSFDLRKGEILGVGGLAGQGQRDLFLTLFGARKPVAGQLSVGRSRISARRQPPDDGRVVARRAFGAVARRFGVHRTGERWSLRGPKDAIRAGIAYVPEDRKAEGLLLPLSIRDNIALTTLTRRSRAGFIRHQAENAAISDVTGKLAIGAGRATSRAAGELSGGNQQKTVMARWLLTDADVFLLYDVTRGVDAATKHDIYHLIADLARNGKAILFYSSETEEIAHLCHRVLVLREGRIAAELAGPVGDAEEIVAASIRETADA
ncbi:sugar ABC transporter ATP-binding protein [Herbidospora mongoliensis]|uniref:sugar ABC transporter ATP-binding protein n=1 Tax=Herbidospora mongoliensis TaxID=688067 RepID=UPI00083088FB|nr:sugar ABC transporter ATP-binding protein [Herbidospora mongoliensis]